LSGGERSRLALARLTLQKANMLLLDEPTNHLDIAARDALEGVLRTYDGTMLFVSHDRYFIDAVATTVWAVEDGALRIYPGTYSDYLEARARGLSPQPTDGVAADGAVPRRPTARRDEPARAPAPLARHSVRDEEVAALVSAACSLEHTRHGLAGRLVHLQGQTLDSLLELAEEHARTQRALVAEDDRLLAAVRRAIG
jgi:ATP-binding cassette subfamily F protein 3